MYSCRALPFAYSAQVFSVSRPPEGAVAVVVPLTVTAPVMSNSRVIFGPRAASTSSEISLPGGPVS